MEGHRDVVKVSRLLKLTCKVSTILIEVLASFMGVGGAGNDRNLQADSEMYHMDM